MKDPFAQLGRRMFCSVTVQDENQRRLSKAKNRNKEPEPTNNKIQKVVFLKKKSGVGATRYAFNMPKQEIVFLDMKKHCMEVY